MSVNEPLEPAARYWKETEATPEPPASCVLAPSATAWPPTVAPATGWDVVPVGAVLSIVIVFRSLPVLPPKSVAVARTSYTPSGRAVVFHENVNGEELELPTFVQLPVPCGLTS